MRFLPILLLFFATSCKPIYRETTTRLYWSDITAENVSSSEKEKIFTMIDNWAARHNFNLLPVGAKVNQSLSSARKPNFYRKLYLRPPDATEPKSEFYITIRDTGTYFRASLATFVSGTKSQVAIQIPEMDTMNKSFQREFSSLKPFKWDSYLTNAEQGAAANP